MFPPCLLHLKTSKKKERFLIFITLVLSDLKYLSETVQICDKHLPSPPAVPNCYFEVEVLKMETDILKILNFEMGSPNVNTFLKSCVGIASENKKIE
uniref:Cyclin-A3-2-like isoform X2 n=1 Tax=Cicer arietinum TaxID=3827 RepID=A0A3Q7YFD8_CICAR|nr:cyclin-A3-2-like isoform X2 [Cicer arietinum]